jgi:hypothetical protein
LDDWKLKIESLLLDDVRRNELGNQARRDVEGYTWVERGRKIVERFLV